MVSPSLQLLVSVYAGNQGQANGGSLPKKDSPKTRLAGLRPIRVPEDYSSGTRKRSLHSLRPGKARCGLTGRACFKAAGQSLAVGPPALLAWSSTQPIYRDPHPYILDPEFRLSRRRLGVIWRSESKADAARASDGLPRRWLLLDIAFSGCRASRSGRWGSPTRTP